MYTTFQKCWVGKNMRMCVWVKGNYWSSNLYEVHGSVMEQEGKVIHRLFGKWHEGLYCGVPPSAKCIWRPGIYTHRVHNVAVTCRKWTGTVSNIKGNTMFIYLP